MTTEAGQEKKAGWPETVTGLVEAAGRIKELHDQRCALDADKEDAEEFLDRLERIEIAFAAAHDDLFTALAAIEADNPDAPERSIGRTIAYRDAIERVRSCLPTQPSSSPPQRDREDELLVWIGRNIKSTEHILSERGADPRERIRLTAILDAYGYIQQRINYLARTIHPEDCTGCERCVHGPAPCDKCGTNTEDLALVDREALCPTCRAAALTQPEADPEGPRCAGCGRTRDEAKPGQICGHYFEEEGTHAAD